MNDADAEINAPESQTTAGLPDAAESKHSTPSPHGSQLLVKAERIHVVFRRSREAAKRLRLLAFLLELGVVTITLLRLLGKVNDAWLPMVILMLTFTEVVCRQWVEQMRTYTQRCRRSSMRAYGVGKDIEPAAAALILEGMPALTNLLKGPEANQSLQQYYNFIDSPPGPSRLRSICAYSAFYSYRLLRTWCVVLFAVFITVSTSGICLLYDLAIHPELLGVSKRFLIVDALFTVIWWFIVIRVWEAFWKALTLSMSFHDIFKRLHYTSHGDALNELLEDYEFERASGFDAPTIIYKARRKSLEKEWLLIREPFA